MCSQPRTYELFFPIFFYSCDFFLVVEPFLWELPRRFSFRLVFLVVINEVQSEWLEDDPAVVTKLLSTFARIYPHFLLAMCVLFFIYLFFNAEES